MMVFPFLVPLWAFNHFTNCLLSHIQQHLGMLTALELSYCPTNENNKNVFPPKNPNTLVLLELALLVMPFE